MSYFDSHASVEAYPELVSSQGEHTVKNIGREGRGDYAQKNLSNGQTQDYVSGEPFPRGYAYLNEPAFANVWTWEWVWDANRWVSLPVQ